ncbi:ceramide glucosyltransferase [Methylobacterium sp. NEAU 140]|uniref:ceramide glucosyltransferase n=1 Tax=Methylobacterium sp. NEAU 140 TaxID=3064945 RepID=UPI00273624FB|nr:ceramide glucosyltransferase [Methylobacterium sp. NEAU 140]MDP4021326.1 ceramide glucosyltransferase [Methylobacterium sp. NEAU 140]
MTIAPDGPALALAAGAILVLVQLASLALAARRIGRRMPESAFPAEAAISLVRPVCGLERFSEETLASGFRLAHPRYELIVCVADAADPVLPLVRRLIAAHPGVPARIVIGEERVSANPKLNNCVRGWEAAHHDWIVLADSNVLMPPDYLQRLQAAWRPDTGLVCATPIGTRPHGFWAEVECAFLNTLQARWQYAGEAVGLGFAQGKSMLWHRPFLEAHGGIRALAAEIAEDAAATKLVRAAGRRVNLVALPFAQPLGPRTLGEVWARQMRWARLRRVTFPLFFAPEIGSGALLPCLAAGLCAGTGEAAAGMAGLLALTYAAEFGLARRAGWHRSPRLLAAMLARDALIPLIWARAWTRGMVVWRGNPMAIEGKPGRVRAA